MTRASQPDELVALFGATLEDLEANRRGALTPRQAELARSATAEDAGFMAVFAGLFAALMYTVLGVLIADGRFFDLSEGLSIHHIIVGLVAGGLPTSALGWAIYTGVIHRRARGIAHVSSCEGPVHLRVRRQGPLALYELRIGKQSFDVSERVYGAVREGDRYRVYFVRISRVVVMAEPLGDDA